MGRKARCCGAKALCSTGCIGKPAETLGRQSLKLKRDLFASCSLGYRTPLRPKCKERKWLDHEFAQAIYWGLQEELVSDTVEAPFNPEEVVTVALLREVLVNFAERCMGLDDFAVTLEGEDGEMVMDTGARLTAFYGRLEAALLDEAA